MKFIHHKQEADYTCGPACLRMALETFGIKKTEQHLAKMLKTNKIRGTWHKSFPEATKKLRLNCIAAQNSSIADIKKLMKQGCAVIVGYFPLDAYTDHYALVKSASKYKVNLLDPYYGPTHSYPIKIFEKIWKSDHKYEKEDKWLFAITKP